MEDLFFRTVTVVAVALSALSSFPGIAQRQDSPGAQQQQASPVPPVAPTATPQNQQQQASDSQEISPAAAQLRPVSAELVGKIDSKSAQQGDSVVVKTDQALTISPGTEIPKGSKLLGHVTSVQARGEGKENSQIAIQFDRAELKDGKTVAIESVIQSVSPAADSGSPNGADAAALNQPGMQGSVPPASTGLNGRAGAASGQPSAAQPPVAQTQGANSSLPADSPAPGSIVARNGNVAIRTTAIAGVLLANDIHGLPFSNASGMLLGAHRDVRLDGGTRIVLAVAMAAQGAGSGMNR